MYIVVKLSFKICTYVNYHIDAFWFLLIMVLKFLNFMCRLPKILPAKKLMHLSSTSRTCWAQQLHSSSTPCMILTEMVLTLSVVTHSVFGRVPLLQYPMASGLTSQIMTHPLSLLSLVRGTLGIRHIVFGLSLIYQLVSVVRLWTLFLVYQVCWCSADHP